MAMTRKTTKISVSHSQGPLVISVSVTWKGTALVRRGRPKVFEDLRVALLFGTYLKM